ncbi:Uncharacterised protein [Lysinibacillus sphaericus]|uniref:Transposase n=1 Tax=Lysinibacillus sphaericus TaxID=1421 RepID=A0AAJ4ZXS6_LYSSH|nr:hypothetical protein LSP03_25200 [Lysinibacillus sphaericus]SUV18640.1 Uncharacterised protein [Lysinibacillus sphaericus]
MVKYTAEDKLQAVEHYLNGKESSYDLAKSMGTIKQSLNGLNNMNTMCGNFYSAIYKLHSSV